MFWGDFFRKSANFSLFFHFSSAASPELRKMVQNNQLDLMVANIPPEDTERLDHVTVLEENLYLVISDHMLKDLFGDAYPRAKKSFAGERTCACSRTCRLR